MIFLNSYEFFQFFFNVWKKINGITVKLLVQSLGIFLSVIWNLVRNTSRIRNVTFIFQNFDFFFKNVSKYWKSLLHSRKLINLFKMIIDRLPHYLSDIFFFQFAYSFSAFLLWKINVFETFNMVDSFSVFCYLANYWNYDRIKLLTESLYVKHL